ncbi:MAG: ERCC4 domain-containing protein [Desulfurococcaceae archaeon]
MSTKLLVPVDLVIDSREDASHPEFRLIFTRNGLKVSLRELPAGDFLLLAPPGKSSLLIERKTVNDFVNSIRDNRLWEQSRLLRESAEKDGHKAVILLEGSLERVEEQRRWRIQSVLRVLDTLILDLNLPVIYTPHKDATVAWIITKAKSLGPTEEKKFLRMRVEKKPNDIEDRVLYVAEGIVGPVLARRLLNKFNTIKNLANASIQDLMSVEGIGHKRAQEIYAIFNTRWCDRGEEVR